MRVMNNLTNLESLGVEARLAGLAAEDAADSRRQSQLQRESAQQDRVQLLRQAADKLREMAGNAIWQGVVSGAAMAASAAMQAGSGFLTDKLTKASDAAKNSGTQKAVADSAKKAVADSAKKAAADSTKKVAQDAVTDKANTVANNASTDKANVLDATKLQSAHDARIQWLAAVSKAADAVGVTGAAPFQASTARLQAEKQDLETDAEQASARAQAASDDVSEAQRMQGSMTSLMQKMLESRHAAMMASVKG